MSRPHPAPPDAGAGRLAELDGIRAVAILMVIAFHFLGGEAPAGTLAAKVAVLLRTSWAGVDLFFVLSGLLIGRILLRHRDDPALFRVFYARRACRIVPLYLAVLGLAALVALGADPGTPGGAALRESLEPGLPAWSYLTFTQNLAMAARGTLGPHLLGVTWSLAVEEQFYLILPPLIRWTPVQRLPWVLGGLMLAGLAARAVLASLRPAEAPLWAYVLLPLRWDALFLGVLIAWVLARADGPERLRRATPALVLASLAGVALLVTGAVTARGMLLSPSLTRFGYPLVALVGAAWVALVAAGRVERLRDLFRHRWMVHIGLVSYGLYLLHQPVNVVLHAVLRGRAPTSADAPGAAVTCLAAAVTLALATATWRWLEQPVVSWSHRRFRYTRVPAPR